MEGEGNYFKACILRKSRRVHVVEAGCQFEKWRLCNSQHNPIDGFHSWMSRVLCGNNGNMQISTRFSVYNIVWILYSVCGIKITLPLSYNVVHN